MYKLKQIAKLVSAEAELVEDVDINEFLVDSRLLNTPASTLFLALVGQNHNGHNYVSFLYSQGVRSFIVSERREEFLSMKDANFLYCASAMSALRTLALFHRQHFGAQVLAITGSNGKTITKEWLAQMLEDDIKVSRSPRSYNSQVGVPLSLLSVKADSKLAIIEAGISLPGEMLRHEELLKPEMGIFTHLGDAHGENFESKESKFYEKVQLFKDSKNVICQEGEIADYFRKNNTNNTILFTWSTEESATANLCILSRTRTDNGCELILKQKISGNSTTINFPFYDDASIENFMSVVSALFLMGYSGEQIAKRAKNLQPIAMRMELKEGVNNSLLINDYYNSDLSSMNIALNTLALADSTRDKMLIMSDFIDVGDDFQKQYLEVARLLKNLNIKDFIGVGEKISSCKDIFAGINAKFYKNTETFLKVENRDDFRNKVVLIKGARKFEFEYIAEFLSKQSHSTILEVDLDAMASNLSYYKSKLPSETKMAVMVKACSYGAGSKEVASMLQYRGVDYLMVAYADEGVELRSAGISVPIGVMNPEPESFDNMIEFSLEPEIPSLFLLEEFNKAVSHYGINDYPVHIKLNTGMNRSGFDEKEIGDLLDFFKKNRNVRIKSVFSHLATSDMPEEDEFTLSQLNLYDRMSSKIIEVFEHKIIRHVLNSAGIERFPSYAYDMVRLGIGLHGISFDNAPLKLTSSFKSYIASLREVPSGVTVGYGRKGRITKDSLIAVVPVGYADGLDRHLSVGVGEMFVAGHRVPIVGNICMDACMIDVTGIDVTVGDEVEIFGNNIPVTEISDKLGTIPYEILTSIAPRVRRVYYRE